MAVEHSIHKQRISSRIQDFLQPVHKERQPPSGTYSLVRNTWTFPTSGTGRSSKSLVGTSRISSQRQYKILSQDMPQHKPDIQQYLPRQYLSIETRKNGPKAHQLTKKGTHVQYLNKQPKFDLSLGNNPITNSRLQLMIFPIHNQDSNLLQTDVAGYIMD